MKIKFKNYTYIFTLFLPIMINIVYANENSERKLKQINIDDQIKAKNSWSKIKIKNVDAEIKQNKSEEVKWKKYIPSYEDYIPKNKKSLNIEYEELKSTSNLPYNIGPIIPQNIFPMFGDFIHNFTQKSSFDGGDAKGTGNQIYSYILHYGLSDKSYISGYISEADDPLYFSVRDRDEKNFWRNYALSYNKKLWELNNKRTIISINSSLEYWNINSLIKTSNDNVHYSKNNYFASTFSFPITNRLNKKIRLSFMPKITLLPSNIGNKSFKGQYYGKNLSLSSGISLNLNEKLYLTGSYTIPFGPGFNKFDNELNFSRTNIYSYGIGWNPNEIVGIKAEIKNSFGETPATSLLTIPSGDLPLYSISLRLIPNNPDTIQKEFSNNEKDIKLSGLSIGNASLPDQGFNQLWLDFDNNGNIFGFYGYSISNIFQLEFLNVGSFADNYLRNNKAISVKETFFSSGNFNNRFGGKLNLLSPLRGDPLWLSTRITLGRDQKSVQGYTFAELLGKFSLYNIDLNLNPKYSWNGLESIGGIGIGIDYKLNKKISLIKEFNFNHSYKEENNNTFSVRYIHNPEKSVDFYYTNALGLQDMGQLFKSESSKFGIRFNLLY